jgi:hypothetical protein
MKRLVLWAATVSPLLFACSSAPPPDPGITAPSQTTDCSASDKNGYGVCYPTADIGTSARSNMGANGTPGNRIQNYAFTGYPATDTNQIDITAGTKTVHLGDYYDPQGKGVPGIIGGVPIKVIHLTVAGVWCGPCNEETDFISGANFTGANTSGASFATELAPLGVVFVQALDDGPVTGVGATISDLNSWISQKHHNDFTSTVDPGNANLGVFFDAAAIPFNMNIDARSMEILTSEVGFDTAMDNTIKTQILPFVNNAATVKQ